MQSTEWFAHTMQTTECMLSASLIRYADTMRCSVSADASCVPEPDEIVSLFLDEFVALAQLAGCTENLQGVEGGVASRELR